ncbi:hypothetical protein IV203_038060 [Nitzschia inconspicua]|uniref:Uncharacterized protein n=1 Tax=Nitzschia inconspicua TaxID=303405 RepID=A0A9K3PYQ5_9STRA|nr:hypothetical protein IV203_038060 [Nitzschia inconspicua]
MVLDVQEYAKQKGIPVGSIPAAAFRKAQSQDFSIRQLKDSKAEAFKKLCFDTKDLLDKCTTQNKSGDTFPAACADLGIKHMECLINKREQAMQVAIQLAGKEKCDVVFPYYEDNKKKALELLEIYKKSSGEKKDVFWG